MRENCDAQQPLHLPPGEQHVLGAVALCGSGSVPGKLSLETRGAREAAISIMWFTVLPETREMTQLNIHANRKVLQSNTKTI